MNSRNVVGLVLALALSACSSKTEDAAAQHKAELAKKSAAAPQDAAAARLVNWQDLVPFVPEQLGEYVQQGEIDGETASIVGMAASRVIRKYEAGGKTLFITITDAIGVDELRAPFAKAATLHEESASGYQKGKRIGDYPVIAVWQTRRQRSEVTMLVADRYVVKVDVRKAASGDEAEKLLLMLDIDRLATLEPSTK